MTYGYGGACNLTASTRVINVFCCPSDNNVAFGGAPSSSETLYTNWGYAGWGPNINSYRGSLGTTTRANNTNTQGVGYGTCAARSLQFLWTFMHIELNDRAIHLLELLRHPRLH